MRWRTEKKLPQKGDRESEKDREREKMGERERENEYIISGYL